MYRSELGKSTNHTKQAIAIVGLAVFMVAITAFCSTGQYAFAKKGQIIQVPIHIPKQLSRLIGSPGILSGNLIRVPIHIPIDLCSWQRNLY